MTGASLVRIMLLIGYEGNFCQDVWVIDKGIELYNTLFYYNQKNLAELPNEIVFDSIIKQHLESGKVFAKRLFALLCSFKD